MASRNCKNPPMRGDGAFVTRIFKSYSYDSAVMMMMSGRTSRPIKIRDEHTSPSPRNSLTVQTKGQTRQVFFFFQTTPFVSSCHHHINRNQLP